jgi:E3 ubiquitin-protein ligase BRE1
LNKQLLVKDEIFNKLLQEKKTLESSIKMTKDMIQVETSSQVSVKNALQPYIERMELSEKSLKDRLIVAESDMAKFKMDADYYRRKHFEALQLQPQELSASLQETKNQKILLERQAAELHEKVNALMHDKLRLEEENHRMSKKLQLYANIGKSLVTAGGGNTAVSQTYLTDLEEQVEQHKLLLLCQTCQKNLKDTVLTKCMHVFCRSCIDTRVESRQRKCPNCNEPFAQSEIKAIYL